MKVHDLGDLERSVMDIVWKRNACSVRDVMDGLGKKKSLAYTTVATVLERLALKGLLVRKKGDKGNIYEPKVSKNLYGERIFSSFLSTFMRSFGDNAVVSFAESIDKLPKEKREKLLNLLNEAEK